MASRPASSELSIAAKKAFLPNRTATGGLAARAVTSASVSPARSSTTREMRPISSASRAGTRRADSIISIARFGLTCRPRRALTMNGHRPRSTSGSPNAAVSEATMMSQPSTSPTPPAKQSPCTDATTGNGQPRIVSTTSRSRPRPSCTSSPVALGAIATRSAPEQKTFSPALLTRTTRASPGDLNASSMPRSTSPFSALRFGSRSMRRRNTPPVLETARSLTSWLASARPVRCRSCR